MIMNKDFPYYLSNFLKDYLKIERNFSYNTIRSYKQVFQSLLDFLVNVKGFKINEVTFETVTQTIVVEFLEYLENTKNNSIRTRNQRLAAIKSFYQYCAIDEIDNIGNINKVLSIKVKKYQKEIQEFLTEEEIEKIFNSIDTTTKIGRRDLLMLVLLYDTAARASEIIKLKLSDIHLEEKYIILTGKGNKKRIVSIMEHTKLLLINYLKENYVTDGYIFTESATYEMVRYVFKKINKVIPNKNITPHVFRRTRATHLLDKGINIIYIQELLGHASIITTQEYAKVITKRKFEAIEKATSSLNNEMLKDWNDDIDLLNQLLSL